MDEFRRSAPGCWQAACQVQRLTDNPHTNSAIKGRDGALAPFRLQATTVTRRQYLEFDKASEFSASPVSFLRLSPISGEFHEHSSDFATGQSDDNFPVICVNWFDAWVFAKWLGPQYRLPKEHEWELAYRAGTRTAYHFGDGCNAEQAN